MQVEHKFSGPHPNRSDIWIGAVTTDDPKAFCDWLDVMMPNHKVVQYRSRSANSIAYDGGYGFRINLHCEVPAEQMIFALTWKGQK